MRNQILGVILTMGLTGTVFAAGEQLANLSSQQPTTADSATTTEEGSVADRTRSMTVNARSRKTQAQFETSLQRNYPQSYFMIKELAQADRQSVFADFKSGTPMKDIRIEVIEMYASAKK